MQCDEKKVPKNQGEMNVGAKGHGEKKGTGRKLVKSIRKEDNAAADRKWIGTDRKWIEGLRSREIRSKERTADPIRQVRG